MNAGELGGDPTERIQSGDIDSAVLAENTACDVECHHLADDQSVTARLKRGVQPAFQADRRFRDPIRPNAQRGDGSKTGQRELVDTSVERLAGQVDRRRVGRRRDVDDELAGGFDVGRTVLEPPPSRYSRLSRTIGGSDDTTVKKLNGARLLTPSVLTVDVQAIGRGTTLAFRRPKAFDGVTSRTSRQSLSVVCMVVEHYGR